MKFTIDEFKRMLPLAADDKWKNGVWDLKPHEVGDVSLVFFAPEKTDYQTFHEENEYYFIARGTAKLTIEGESFDCAAGDAFYVPALKRHHFEDFSDDFATWAIFF